MRIKRLLICGLALTAFTSHASSSFPAEGVDPSLKAKLGLYQPLGTLTGACFWRKAKMHPFRDVVGRLYYADEHNPTQFFPKEKSQLPKASWSGGAVAFLLSDHALESRAFAIDGDVRLSGTILVGELRCYGNASYNPGANHTMAASFLVDSVSPVSRDS